MVFPEVDAAYLSPVHLLLFLGDLRTIEGTYYLAFQTALSGIDPIPEGAHAFQAASFR